MVDGIHFKDAGPRRRLQDLHANELRLKLENAGISYPRDATKAQLVALVQQHKL